MIFSRSFKRQMEKELENSERQEAVLEERLKGVRESIAKIREILDVTDTQDQGEQIPASAPDPETTESV